MFKLDAIIIQCHTVQAEELAFVVILKQALK